MEEGATIPLFFLSMCCVVLTPILGFSALAHIRFSLKDRALARNVLITLAIVASLPVLYVIAGIFTVLFILPACCAETSRIAMQHLPEILADSLRQGLWMMFLSLTPGFLIAFGAVLPITLLVRRRKAKKAVDADAVS